MKVCRFLDVPYEEQKIITCHIGNGASITAIKNGRSVDTSMGMTPVEGLLMGTRSGDVDAGVLTYIMEKENVGAQAISTIVNKSGGVLGISGVSSDMREIEAAIENGDERAALALKSYNYRIKKYVGSYAAALGGLDILVFTGGVGENMWKARAAVCENMEFFGIKLDEEKNKKIRGIEAVISTEDSPVKVVVIPTDEEFMIALDTLKSIVKS
jgi:acetate kinase